MRPNQRWLGPQAIPCFTSLFWGPASCSVHTRLWLLFWHPLSSCTSSAAPHLLTSINAGPALLHPSWPAGPAAGSTRTGNLCRWMLWDTSRILFSVCPAFHEHVVTPLSDSCNKGLCASMNVLLSSLGLACQYFPQSPGPRLLWGLSTLTLSSSIVCQQTAFLCLPGCS